MNYEFTIYNPKKHVVMKQPNVYVSTTTLLILKNLLLLILPHSLSPPLPFIFGGE